MTYHDLHQTFLAYRREHGAAKTTTLLLRFGADTAHAALDTVPEANWPALLKALTNAHEARPTSSLAETRAELSSMSSEIWNRWNYGHRRDGERR